MSALENRDDVVAGLHAAADALSETATKATEREGDQERLQGETQLLIGGLSQVVRSLAEMMEPKPDDSDDSERTR